MAGAKPCCRLATLALRACHGTTQLHPQAAVQPPLHLQCTDPSWPNHACNHTVRMRPGRSPSTSLLLRPSVPHPSSCTAPSQHSGACAGPPVLVRPLQGLIWQICPPGSNLSTPVLTQPISALSWRSSRGVQAHIKLSCAGTPVRVRPGQGLVGRPAPQAQGGCGVRPGQGPGGGHDAAAQHAAQRGQRPAGPGHERAPGRPAGQRAVGRAHPAGAAGPQPAPGAWLGGRVLGGRQGCGCRDGLAGGWRAPKTENCLLDGL